MKKYLVGTNIRFFAKKLSLALIPLALTLGVFSIMAASGIEGCRTVLDGGKHIIYHPCE